MFLVEEKMGAAAVDEDDELLLVFWRLGAGALLVPVVVSVSLLVDIFLKEGVWSWFCFSGLTLLGLVAAMNCGGGRRYLRDALKGSKSRRDWSCLVISFNYRRRRLQPHV